MSRVPERPVPNLEQLSAKINREIARNPRRALQMAQKGVSLARKKGSPSQVARMFQSRAHAFRECGLYKDAIQDYDRAARMYKKEGKHLESWRTTIGKLDALDQLGKYQDALKVGHKARRYFKNAGFKIWEAKIDANLGNVYQHLDRYQEALEHYQFAQDVLSLAQPLDGHVARFNQATVYLCIGEPASALPLLAKCRDFFDEQNLSSFLGRTHYNLAFGNYLLGKYQDALQELAEARKFFRKFRDTRFLAACYLDEAELFLRLNRFDEAIACGRKAASIFGRLKKPYERAEAAAILGDALLGAGKISEAITSFKSSRTFFRKHKNLIKSAELNSQLAHAYARMNQFELAKSHLKDSFHAISTHKLYPKMLSVLTQLAELEITGGDWKGAERELRKAKAWIRHIKLPSVLYPFYLAWGKVELRLGRKNARKKLERAIELVESMRSEIPSEDLRISFFENKLAAYHVLLSQDLLRLDRPSIERAFRYTERARSRVLMDLLEGAITFERDRKEMSKLLAEISALQNEKWRRSIRQDENYKGVRDERRRELKIVTLLRQIQRAQVKPALEDVSISRLQSALLPDQVLISYYILESVLHAFVLTDQDIDSHPAIADASRLFQRWQFWRLKLEAIPAGAEIDDRSHQDPLSELSSALILPMYERLREYRIWTIIPHGWLHTFPFHSLSGPDGPFIEKHVFTYAPSASIFLHSQRNEDSKGDRVLVLGHADNFAPQINREATTIQQIFPAAQVFTNQSANSAKLQDLGSEASIIHIASHGRFLKDKPLFSGLLLSDGWLTVPQIYAMRLHADLVTLSGCETGTNEISSGDELLGLTRAFLFAGASSLLVSLWRVFDESSAFFMKVFYGELAVGKEKSNAWHQAVLQTRARWSNPYYWAPFLLVGKL